MSNLTRGKIIGYILVLFLAGAAAGSLITWQFMQREMAELRPPPDITAMLRDTFSSGLTLTPDQKQKVEPIIIKTGKQMQELRMQSITNFSKAREDFYNQLKPILTDEQKLKLEQMDEEHREAIRKRFALPKVQSTEKTQ